MFFQGQPTRCYFKRYKMELDTPANSSPPELPEDYSWAEWNVGLADEHALALFNSFQGEMDSRVFHSFQSYQGCQGLMNVLQYRIDFLPQAAWLIRADKVPCGTIQAILQKNGVVSIQNIGITPKHRGLGLGSALIQKLIFSAGQGRLPVVSLEVTAENTQAIRLYQRLGFHKTKLLYKEVDLKEPVATVSLTNSQP